MRNVSDAGVKALGEAGCGCGLRTLILGAVLLCPFHSYCGFWIAVWHSDVFLFDGVLFLVRCWYCLVTKCPRYHELGDHWSCVT